MSLSVLDTDALTLLFHGQPEIVRRVSASDLGSLAITIITVDEVLSGWYAQVRRARNDDQLVRAYEALRQAVQFFGTIPVLGMTAECVKRFHGLRSQNRRVGTNNLRIAAIALEHQTPVITRNIADFQAIAGLKIEDWMSSTTV